VNIVALVVFAARASDPGYSHVCLCNIILNINYIYTYISIYTYTMSPLLAWDRQRIRLHKANEFKEVSACAHLQKRSKEMHALVRFV